ncbi:class I adenylate-forming enzyme family protein [Amycolatopsis pithecellobii]|uniref:AMP-binding protein n=1 Tax=Amycolatopsis pithecellobii TaxID=664692 RepID=A0A6N7Z6U6_9PSEU|nr:AMP-binding protein [Amycolatopsis pithecellobii]MTD56590.1 AMP-binding protein [Amycolatopsis pithecellobii]
MQAVERVVPRWPEPLPPIWSQFPAVPVADAVVPLLERDPHAPALTFEDGLTVSRATLLEECRRFTAYLRTRITPGDRVVLAIGNRAEFFVAWLSVLAARGVAVKLSPRIGPADAAHVVRDSGAVLAVCEPQAVAVLGDLLPERVVTVADDEPSGLAEFGRDLAPASLTGTGASASDMAGLTYTSGTTGPPKGCVHDQRQYLRYADLKLRILPYAPDDVLLNPLQFYYGDSIWLWLACLRSGARFVSMRRFSVSRFWPVVREFGVTTFLGIGAIPTLLLSAPPSEQDRQHRVRFAAQIGVPPDRHRELVDRFGFPWVEGYGMSECGSAIAMPIAASEHYIGTGAIGIPVPDVDIALIDDNGDHIAGPGTGQLIVRTPDMMGGYLNRPKATAEVLQDGWLRTGDVVRRDENGVVYFLGRKKLIIRRGGENIAPEEVEAVLRQHESIVDSAVVPVQDPLWGEEIKAYVELHAGQVFEPEKLAAFCAERLSAFKVPRYFEHRTEPFPRTPSMRIQKSALAVDGAHLTESAKEVSPRVKNGSPQE